MALFAKFPSSSWRNFSITLKHKRQQTVVVNLLADLDVEEKVWAKDASKAPEG
jgi:hypothetical protein